MNENSVDIQRQTEIDKDPDKYLSAYIMPGGLTSVRSNEPVHAAIEGKQQVGRVVTVQSVFSAEEAPVPHESVAKDILQQMRKNEEYNKALGENSDIPRKKVLLLPNSLGMAYTGNVMQEMLKEDKDLVERNMQDLEIMMSGPEIAEGGINGLKNTFDRVGRLKRLNSTLLVAGHKPDDTTVAAGMEALRYVPPEILEDGQKINQQLREIFSENSNVAQLVGKFKGVGTIGMVTDHSILSHIPEEAQPELKNLLNSIVTEIHQWENANNGLATKDTAYKNLRQLASGAKLERALIEYANYVQPYVGKAYEGDYRMKTDENGNQVPLTKEDLKDLNQLEGFPNMAVGFEALAEKLVVGKALLIGEARKMVKRFIELGMKPSQITLYAPEWDAYFGPKEVKELVKALTVNGERPNIIVAEGEVHSMGQASGEATQVGDAIDFLFPARRLDITSPASIQE